MEKTQDNCEVYNNAVNFYMPPSLVPKASFRPKTQSDRLKVKETPILIQFTLFFEFIAYSKQTLRSQLLGLHAMITITWNHLREEKSCPHKNHLSNRPVMLSTASSISDLVGRLAEVNGQVRIALRCSFKLDTKS